MRRRPVPRCADHERLCRRCATPTPETSFEAGDWVCPFCRARRVEIVMPITERGGWQRYDTSEVFAGFKVRKVFQGGPEYETEVGSPAGEFYACGEAFIAFYAVNTRWANIVLEEFPGARCVARGEDGRAVVRFPVELFPAVAKRAGAYRKRTITEKERAHLAAARERSPIGRRKG